MVSIEGVGHAVWPFKAEFAREVLAAWFHGEELLLRFYEGDADPAGN